MSIRGVEIGLEGKPGFVRRLQRQLPENVRCRDTAELLLGRGLRDRQLGERLLKLLRDPGDLGVEVGLLARGHS